jgi:hypothetical protein
VHSNVIAVMSENHAKLRDDGHVVILGSNNNYIKKRLLSIRTVMGIIRFDEWIVRHTKELKVPFILCSPAC